MLSSFLVTVSSEAKSASHPEGEDIIHIQRTFHLEGSESALYVYSKSLLNGTIEEIKKAFKN